MRGRVDLAYLFLWLGMGKAEIMSHPLLGILMLDTQFPRILGDVGNPRSFDFPVVYRTVPGATPEAIVLNDPRVWIDAFVEVGQSLVAEGCRGLATTCGFLTLVRDEVSQACGVPVAASSLEQVKAVAQRLPKGKVPGILTISQSSLSPAHLAAGEVPEDLPIQGVDGGAFATAILGNHVTFDPATASKEMVLAAQNLCTRHPEIGALVLECTNMPPYAAEIEAATDLPVYSILTHLNQFHSTLVQQATMTNSRNAQSDL